MFLTRVKMNPYKTIPTDLAECVAELDRFLGNEDKALLKIGVVGMHFSLGMWIRDNWGLWERGPLYQYLEEMGFIHPDDMSDTILEYYHHYLNGKVYDVQNAIDKYKKYWEENSENDPR